MFKVIRGKTGCGDTIEVDGIKYLALSPSEVIKACEHYIWRHEVWKEDLARHGITLCPICIKRYKGG